MRLTTSILLLLAVFTAGEVFSQDSTKTSTTAKPKKKKKFLKETQDKVTFEKAEQLFDEENYAQALPLYKKLEAPYPDEPILMFRMGVCYLYDPEGHRKALDYLMKPDPEKFKKTDLAFYLGKAYHINYKFDEAIAQLEPYVLRKDIKPKFKGEGDRLIQYCNYGKVLLSKPVTVKKSNVGPPVNTYGSEYVPVISSDESSMVLTYRGEKSKGGRQFLPGQPDPDGEYFEDIYTVQKDSTDKWKAPVPIDNINTDGHDACVALSGDGQKLFIFKNLPNDIGALFMSNLEGDTWSDPQLLRGDINSTYWEGSCSMSADEHTIFFSSERTGGYGGKDIYSAKLQSDGSWGEIKNLGEKVNTFFDDDAPFIHPSGEFLIFSSKGHNTMGGYDLFRTDLEGDSTWSLTQNLGYPISTTGDDIYYVISADGQKGYYSSGEVGGFGMQDIYLVAPGIVGKKIVLVLAKGEVTLDDKPVKAEIEVINTMTGKTIATYASNEKSGKYMINFPGGKEYKIIFKLTNYDPLTRKLNTMKVDSFYEANIDVQFYSKNFITTLQTKKDSINSTPLINTTPVDTVKTTPVKPLTLREVVAKYGDYTAEGLEFKVQIGAYNLADNFNYGKILKLGKVNKQKLEDGITRFTMGNQKSLNEAYKFKAQVVEAGVSDAFVTAVYKGKRYLISELAAKNFFSEK